MGSGSRFVAWWVKGICLGITFDTFPFALTVTMLLPFCAVSIGFGNAYDDPESER